MKNRNILRFKTILLSTICVASLTLPMTANAAVWQQNASGYWNLISDEGLALKGWQNYEGNTYYFDEMGNMLTGMQDIDGNTYYFDENGVMMADWWLKDGYSHFGTAWYYFQYDGTMAHGWTLASDGKVYYFDSPGYPGAVWTISGSCGMQGVGPEGGVATYKFHYVYGDVTECAPLDMTCSESEFWWALKQSTGLPDEGVSKLVSLVPGKWYQQADRCAAVLWNQGYDRNSAYQAMINRGFTEDQATWACCMKWPTVNDEGLWLNEKGEYVTCEELTDSHRYDINENIDVAYQHDTSTDIRYQNGPYTYTLTGVNATRPNSNASESPNLTLEDFNYFEDVITPGSIPGNAWKGDVPPTEVPDDPTAAVVPVTFNEDGSISMDMDKWEEVNEGLETGEYHALDGGPGGPAEAYAAEHNMTMEELAAQVNGEDGWAYPDAPPAPSKEAEPVQEAVPVVEPENPAPSVSAPEPYFSDGLTESPKSVAAPAPSVQDTLVSSPKLDAEPTSYSEFTIDETFSTPSGDSVKKVGDYWAVYAPDGTKLPGLAIE